MLALAVLVAACSTPAAMAWRTPTIPERQRILSVLAPLYRQPCVRTSVRVSSVSPRFAGVLFRFVAPPAGKARCLRFNQQVLLKRIGPLRWKVVAEDDLWPCHPPRVSPHAHQVIKDLFGRCAE